MEGLNMEIIVINVFVTPENMGIDTKIKFLRVSDPEILANTC